MISETAPAKLTSEDYLRQRLDRDFELVDGEIREFRTSVFACHVVSSLSAMLSEFVEQNELGLLVNSRLVCCSPSASPSASPSTIRKFHIAFIHRERVPANWRKLLYLDSLPDLVVHVVSPTDDPGELDKKMTYFLDGGARLAWVIDPERHTATTYRSDGTVANVLSSSALDGEELLPGFSCKLSVLLAD